LPLQKLPHCPWLVICGLCLRIRDVSTMPRHEDIFLALSCGAVMMDEYKYWRLHITHPYSLQVFCLIATFITSSHSLHIHIPCAIPPSFLLPLAGRYFLVGRQHLPAYVDSELTLFYLEPESPAAYAAPVPSQIDSVGGRGWIGYGNKFAEVVSTSLYAWFYKPYPFPASRRTLTLRPNLRCKTWSTC
jgi:hypothetical protein